MVFIVDEGHSSSTQRSESNAGSSTSSQEILPEIGTKMLQCIYTSLILFLYVGYHDTPLNFGVIKKDKASAKLAYRPASDFGFDILAEVICSNPNSSGFMINLTPDRGNNDNSQAPTRFFNTNRVLLI